MSWAVNTTTNSSHTFMSMKTVSLMVNEVDKTDELFIFDTFESVGIKPTMYLIENFGQVLPNAQFTYTYVYETQLKDLKKVYFKLLLKYPGMTYSF